MRANFKMRRPELVLHAVCLGKYIAIEFAIFVFIRLIRLHNVFNVCRRSEVMAEFHIVQMNCCGNLTLTVESCALPRLWPGTVGFPIIQSGIFFRASRAGNVEIALDRSSDEGLSESGRPLPTSDLIRLPYRYTYCLLQWESYTTERL
jgi:hypothetical protein